MAKYARDLDETLVQKVKSLSNQFGLKEQGVKIEAVRLKKGKTYGEVLKPNDLVKLFTGEENVVAVALYEELFDQCDEQTQDVLIENLLGQIYATTDKDDKLKIKIEKPQLNVELSVYHRYGNIATQKLEAAILILDQLAEQEKQQRELNKGTRGKKKQQAE